jgi:hypothetical protein
VAAHIPGIPQLKEKKQMIKTKLRAAIAMTGLALVLVGGAASTADAAPKNHNQKGNAAAKRQLCEDLKLIMTTNQDEAKSQWEAGNSAAASEADDNATKAYNDARHSGCGWAARTPPPDSPYSPETSDGDAPPPVLY